MVTRLLPDDFDQRKLFEGIGVERGGVSIMERKAHMLCIYIQNLKTPAANILKQDALSLGAELAVPMEVVTCQKEFVDAILMATPRQLEYLVKKEKAQPFGLKKLSDELSGYLQTEKPTIPVKIMGVVNLNDDSFFAHSRSSGLQALHVIEKMIAEGADWIDVGAVSSRPGSVMVSEEEETERLRSLFDALRNSDVTERAVFSIDTFRPVVARRALGNGFRVINDITGLEDENMAPLVAQHSAAVVVMHMQGEPQTMQQNPQYQDVMADVERFFEERLERAYAAGVKEVILDPGIGFGKSLEHNLVLIKNLKHFQKFGCEILVGASRKSLIDKVVPSPVEDRLPGTLALHLESIRRGASIIRCHDVKEHCQAIAMQQAVWESDHTSYELR